MTDRLYYIDPYNREFDATIVRREGTARVTLDRTSFYPTSGGQPFDTGTLGGVRVVDVVDEDDGTITHVLEGELAVGQTVHGVIDWPRRFDHMQQHTGQHVLSAAFDRLFGVRTVSFHLGAAVSTIDLARELAPRDIAAAESEANRIVWENRPVTIRFADAEAAAKLPLRKRLRPARDASPGDDERERVAALSRERQGWGPGAVRKLGPHEHKNSKPPRTGNLRLIDVEDFDLSACGGTHVARTGAIGLIAVGSCERFKGGQRIEFRCGGRALDRLRSLRDTVAAAIRLLSVTAEELPEAIERFQGEVKDQKRAVALLQTELARYRAADLAASAAVTDRGRLVLRAVDADANGLRSLASAIVAASGYAAVLVSTSAPALVVVARSADVNLQANQLLTALTARFGGRGGGKPELAQGGGLSGSPQDILDAARVAIATETQRD
jgi:alanyl-tRNA synthetase